jgi:hypothetical protein
MKDTISMELSEDVSALLLEDADRPLAEDKLERLRAYGGILVQQKLRIAELEEQLKEQKQKFNKLVHEEVPSLFMEVGVDRVGIPELGYDVVMKDYYHANIAADWPDDRREAAFTWLEREGHGDIIRLIVSVQFGREEYNKAMLCYDLLKKSGLQPTLQKSVPWNTLTAWLREQVERYARLPPLELLGATVGKIVKLVERKNG